MYIKRSVPFDEYISHDEVMIRNFMEEPEYADFLLKDVLADGSAEEISLVRGWYDEARLRIMGAVAQA